MEPNECEPLTDSPGSFRLFEFRNDQVSSRGKLKLQDLAHAPDYVALSYVCGKPAPDTPEHDFQCSNAPKTSISYNLHLAMNELRRRRITMVWADAICIRGDKGSEERNRQIRLMSKIYQQAAKVVIWLGENPRPDLIMVDICQGLVNVLSKLPPGKWVDPSPDDFKKLGLPIKLDIWTLVADLLQHTWFTRLWCVQECALAREVEFWFGNETIQWDMLKQVADQLRTHGLGSFVREVSTVAANDEERLARLRCGNALKIMVELQICRNAILREPEYRVGIPQILLIMRNREVTEAADRIFGILGLIDQSIPECITVDTGMAAHEVYLEFAQSIVQNDVTLLLLSNNSADTEMSELPSWCPNFASPMLAKHGLGGGAGRSGYHSSSIELSGLLRKKCSIKFNAENKTIDVPGFKIDVVDEVISESCSIPGTTMEEKIQGQKWLNDCLALSKRVLHDSNPASEAFCRTLCGNMTFPAGDRRDLPCCNEFLEFQGYLEALATGTSGVLPTESGIEYSNAVRAVCQGRNFFSTKSGRIGFGPAAIKYGDIVCIFDLGFTPFVVRAVDLIDQSGNNRLACRLVGEAYVDGLMYGEGLRDRDCSDANKIHFIIN